MQISPTDERELLTVLHAGMHEQPAWATFLGRLRRRVRAAEARLLLARGEAALEIAARADRRDVESRARPLAAPDDPIPYGSLRPQRVYAFAEFPAPPASPGRIVRAGTEELDGWLAITGAEEDFTPQDAAFLGVLAPHLAIALGNYAVVERERLQRRAGDWALGRLGRGWLALTAGGRIVAADELAERILREGVHLRQTAERRLLAASPAAHQRLAQALDAVAAGPAAAPRAVRISEDPQLELLIAPIGREKAEPPVIGAAAVAHLQGPPPAGADPAAALGDLFDLSPGLARFAWTLARTGGIAESSAELGLSLETARFYSKQLYAKLGVKGQAELARRILTSAAALG